MSEFASNFQFQVTSKLDFRFNKSLRYKALGWYRAKSVN